VGDEPPAGGVPPRVGGAPPEGALAVVVGFGLTGVGAGAVPEPGSGVGAFWPSAEGDAATVPVGTITGLVTGTRAPGERDGSWAAAEAAGSARGDVDVLAGAGLADRALQPDRATAAAAATPASVTAARTRCRSGQKLPLTIPQNQQSVLRQDATPGNSYITDSARQVAEYGSLPASYQPAECGPGQLGCCGSSGSNASTDWRQLGDEPRPQETPLASPAPLWQALCC
jgi:hypothetical protein